MYKYFIIKKIKMNFYQRKFDRRRKNSNFLKNFFIIFTILLLVWGFVFYKKYNNFKNDEIIIETRQIKIEKWDNISKLWEKISEFNNIFYEIYFRNNKQNFDLKEWTYILNKWDTIEKTFENLQKPIKISEINNFTIIPWWNIFDIDKNLAEKNLISKWEYINYVTSKEKINSLSEFFNFLKNKDLESLEWFLYPDTYWIDSKNFKINNFVIMQLETFEKKVYKKLFEWKYNNETIYDVINLASIVEKEESRIKKEQPIVAGILKKRLNAWWMIWADATVCYPYKLPTSECTQKIVNKYVYEKNDYNTRTMKWLPKTPIANPSFDTINSTLNDKKTDYWYYLHNLKTWKIYYAKTNEEHNYNRANFMN